MKKFIITWLIILFVLFSLVFINKFYNHYKMNKNESETENQIPNNDNSIIEEQLSDEEIKNLIQLELYGLAYSFQGVDYSLIRAIKNGQLPSGINLLETPEQKFKYIWTTIPKDLKENGYVIEDLCKDGSEATGCLAIKYDYFKQFYEGTFSIPFNESENYDPKNSFTIKGDYIYGMGGGGTLETTTFKLNSLSLDEKTLTADCYNLPIDLAQQYHYEDDIDSQYLMYKAQISFNIVNGQISFNSIKVYKVDDYNETPTDVEQLDVNSDLVVKLMDIYKIFDTYYSSGQYRGYFYQKEKYTVDNIDNQVKILLGYKYQMEQKYGNNFYRDDPNNCYEYLSQDELKKSIQNLLGPNVSYIDENLRVRYNYVDYDSVNSNYKYARCHGFGGTRIPVFVHKVTSALKYSDRLEIIEKIYFSQWDENQELIYKNSSIDKLGTLIGNSYKTSEENFNVYGNKLDSYKYTFKYENGNYYLSTIELVK